MATQYKQGKHPNTLAGLKPRPPKNIDGKTRTIWASTRICPESKEKLNIMLKKMNMSLADFLEAIARNEIEVVKK
jgi:hypothetical protein